MTGETQSIDTDGLARDLGALAHPVRLQILRHLAEKDACCNKDVVARVGLAQSTVSQHLKILVDAGLVIFSQDAQRSRYRINALRLSGMASLFATFADHACCCSPDCVGKPGDHQ